MPRLKRKNTPEEDFQRTVKHYFDSVLGSDVFWCHIPNGGRRGKAEAGAFKAMGVKAGVPDLLLIYRGKSYFIELKDPAKKKPKYSDTQRDTVELLLRAGATCALANSIEDIRSYLHHWNIPTRETVQ